MRCDERGGWLPAGTPVELRAGVEDNSRGLGCGTGCRNLRILGAAEPDQQFDDQVGAMVELRAEGLIGGVGVSNVSLAQLQRATELTEIACVQNPFNVVDRTFADVLTRCETEGIAFVPFFPIGSAFGGVNRVLEAPAVTETASRLDATPAQVALAWLLARSPSILLIPGTSSVAHLEENLAAGALVLEPRRARRDRLRPAASWSATGADPLVVAVVARIGVEEALRDHPDGDQEGRHPDQHHESEDVVRTHDAYPSAGGFWTVIGR